MPTAQPPAATPFEPWQAAIDAASLRDDLRLHIGCGKTLMDGWINIDGNPRDGVLQLTLPQGMAGFADAGFTDISDSDCNSSAFEDLRVDYRALRDNHGRALSLYVDAVKAGA